MEHATAANAGQKGLIDPVHTASRGPVIQHRNGVGWNPVNGAKPRTGARQNGGQACCSPSSKRESRAAARHPKLENSHATVIAAAAFQPTRGQSWTRESMRVCGVGFGSSARFFRKFVCKKGLAAALCPVRGGLGRLAPPALKTGRVWAWRAVAGKGAPFGRRRLETEWPAKARSQRRRAGAARVCLGPGRAPTPVATGSPPSHRYQGHGDLLDQSEVGDGPG